MFRHSKFIETVNKVDTAILSNITTVKLHKSFTASTSASTTYTINFSNALYNPHSGHNATGGGILSTSGFKINGDTTNEYFLDEDGEGNVRLYYLVAGVLKAQLIMIMVQLFLTLYLLQKFLMLMVLHLQQSD